MLEGVVAPLLNQLLGSFVEGLDRQQLHLKLWSGKVNLRNLTIKPSALEQLGLPIELVSGRIESLTLDANWRALQSQPVIVELSGVEALVKPRQSFNYDAAEALQRAIANKLASLAAVEEFRLSSEKEALESRSSSAKFMAKLVATIIDNVQISIKDIHVRVIFTDTSSNTPAMFGVGLEELSAITTDSKGQPAFVAPSQSQSQQHSQSFRQVRLKNLFAYTNDNFLSEGGRIHASDVLCDNGTQYLIEPVNASLSMVHHKDGQHSSRIEMQLSAKSIAVRATQANFHRVLHLTSLINEADARVKSSLTDTAPQTREPSKEERNLYTTLYKRSLNALWLPELTVNDRATLDRLESELNFTALARTRTEAFYQLKRELGGRTVMRRQEAVEMEAKSKGTVTGLFRGLFRGGAKQPALPSQPVPAAQQADIPMEDEEIDDSPLPTLSLAVRFMLPTIELMLLESFDHPLLMLNINEVSADWSKDSDTSQSLTASLKSIRAIDCSNESRSFAESRKEIIAVSTNTLSTRNNPFEIKVNQQRDDRGRVSTDVTVKLEKFKFSMAAVLIRTYACFIVARPSNLTLAPTKAPNVNTDSGGSDSSDALVAPTSIEPQLFHINILLQSVSLQLIADRAIEISPALLFSLSGALTVDIDKNKYREVTSVSGALRDIQCYVTDLDSTDTEHPITDKVNTRILYPFAVKLSLTQTVVNDTHTHTNTDHDSEQSASLNAIQFVHLPRRIASLTVEPIRMRFSYSSYRLVSNTMESLIADAHLDTALTQAKFKGGDIADADIQTTINNNELATIDSLSLSQTTEKKSLVSLFNEEDFTFTVQSVNVSLVNDCLRHEVPFATIAIDKMVGDCHSYGHSRTVRISLTASVSLFDYALVTWSPIIERFALTAVLTSSITPVSKRLSLTHGAQSSQDMQPVTDADTSTSTNRMIEGSLTHWLTLTSSQSLNLNVSHAMLTGLIDVLNLLTKVEKSQHKHSHSNKLIESAPAQALQSKGIVSGSGSDCDDKEFMPFRIENQTEFEIKYVGKYQLKSLMADDDTNTTSGNVSDKSQSSQFGPWSVSAYSQSPFAFPDTANHANQSLVIEFQQSAYQWPTLSIPFTRTSVHQHRLPANITVVSEVFIEEGVKVCRLRSRLGVSNRTDVEFEWSTNNQSLVNLRPQSTIFLPLTSNSGNDSRVSIQLRPKTTNQSFSFSAPLAIGSQLTNDSKSMRFVCSRVLPPDDDGDSALSFASDFGGVLYGASITDTHLQSRIEDEIGVSGSSKTTHAHAHTDASASSGNDSPHATVFSIRPPVLFENLCAHSMEYRIQTRAGKGDIVVHQSTVSSGVSVPLFAALQSMPSLLSYRFPSLLQSAWSSPLPLLGDREERDRRNKSLLSTITDQHSRELTLNADYQSIQGCLVLSLFAPYWLFDQTGLGLVMSGNKKQTVPLGNFQSFKQQMTDDAVRAVMFSLPPNQQRSSDSKDRKACLSTFDHIMHNDNVWSEPISLDAVGLTFTLSLPGSGTNSQSLTDIGVSIESGVGRWRRTKMIVLVPRLIIVNELATDIAIIQRDDASHATTIAAGSQLPWSWPNSKDKKLLSFRRLGTEYSDWLWSGLFLPSRIGTVNMSVRHSSHVSQLWFVRIESRIEGATVFCTISQYPHDYQTLMTVLPYRLVNRTLFHTVRFRQQKEGISYGPWIEVSPQSSMPYAWEAPLLSGEIECMIGMKHSDSGERWDAKRFVVKLDDSNTTTLPTLALPSVIQSQPQQLQQLYSKLESIGPTRVLTFALFPSLVDLESRLLKEQQSINDPRKRKKRWQINGMLQSTRYNELKQCLSSIEANIAQVTAMKTDSASTASCEWERVRQSIHSEMARVENGKVDGIVISANTEVQYLARITGLLGIEAAARELPAIGGRIIARLTSDLTNKVSSALLYYHPTDIRQALVATANSKSPPVESGQTVFFYVPEDSLDIRRGDTLHTEFLFIPNTHNDADADSDASKLNPSRLMAKTSLPLNDVPVSSPDSLKPSQAEQSWTNRVIPLHSCLRHNASNQRYELSMTITIRQFLARSDEQRPQSKLSLNLASIGLSLINDTPEELMFASISGISATLEQAKTSETVFVRVDHIQLDNQLPSAIFPVIVAPTYVSSDDRQPVVQISLNKLRSLTDHDSKTKFGVWSFPYFSVLIQSLDVKMEESLIYSLIQYANQLSGIEIANTNSANDVIHTNRVIEKRKSELRLTKNRNANEKLLYFRLLQIQPLQFYVSFLAKPGMRAKMAKLIYNPFQLILSAAGTTLGSIENAPIRLHGRVLENVLNTAPVLVSSLVQAYQSDVIAQGYKIIGSLEFLGNPSEFINTLGTGISDFFYEPAKGLIKSPQDFGRGVAAGTASLVKNTVGGLFTSASKITGSMGKAAAFLSMDEEFIANQQLQQLKQPTNAVTGVVGGVQTLGQSLFQGVTGVVMDPIKGAQKGGVEGFMKGVGKGLAGVLAKPTAGLIGATSAAMKGIGNTVNDTEKTQAKRVRPQRRIDRETGLIVPYSAQQQQRPR